MTGSTFSGPLVSAGNMLDGLNGVNQKTAVAPGPNIFYHASGFPDVRYAPINKERIDRHASIPCFFSAPTIFSVNAIPQTLGAANISALANSVNGTPVTLAAASTGISTNIPILPFGTSTPVVAPIVLDFGIELASVTSGSKTVTVADSTKYLIGMPVIIAQALTASMPLISFVTGLPSSTTITINDAAGYTNAAAPLGSGNAWGQLDNLPPYYSTYASPYIAGGPGAFFDASQALARCVSITGVSGGAGGNFLISGWDEYWNPMTDTVTVAAGANTVNSLKAFKAINTVTPQFTDAHNYSVGTADIFGLPLRCDLWEQLEIYFNGALVTSNTGFTKADLTNPATSLTGDTRGTYALQSASNGTKRLVMSQSLTFAQLRASPTNLVPLYGVTPA